MRTSRLCFFVLAGAAGAAQAEATLGDLMDRGARRLDAQEIRALGDVRILQQAPDADAYMTLRADGSVVGMVHNKQGFGSSEAGGRWEVDAGGRRCSQVELPAFGTRVQHCGYTFQLGRELFFAASANERSAHVTAAAGPAFLR
jgi:hypothetical protein